MLDLISNESDTIPRSKVEYLVQAETAEHLEDSLREGIFNWIDDDRYNWEKLGKMANNRVLAEMTDGLTGVVENITNAGDAYLLQDYDGEGDFKNSHRAADELLSKNEEVIVRFDGNKGRGRGSSDFSISFADNAHGQPQDNFSVFVDPLESGVSKTEFGFLQGCRGVGGMTALTHAENGYKFIASSPDSGSKNWTWTVIREDDDGDFQYLKIDGDFPVFEGDFDCGDGIGVKEQGTVVKLYSYNLESNPNNAAEGAVFRRRLSRRLVRPVTPIRIKDVRYGDEYLYEGLHKEVDKHKESFVEPIQIEDNVVGLGDVLIDIFIAEDEDKREELHDSGSIPEEHLGHMTEFFTSSNESRVLVSVNGQVQSTCSKADLKSCGDVKTVSEEMIVVVRCIENSKTVSSDVFNTARNGFSDESVESRLTNTVFGSIRSNGTIQDINSDRSERYGEASTVAIPDSMTVDEGTVNCPVDGNQTITLNFDTATCEFMESCQTEFDIISENIGVKSATVENSDVTVKIIPDNEVEIGSKEDCKFLATIDGSPFVSTFTVSFIEQTGNTITTKTGTKAEVPEETTILQSVVEYSHMDSKQIEETFDSINPQNMMGEPVEAFVKNLVCGVTESDNVQVARDNCLSWQGSKNHPPDMIIDKGSAIEVKHQRNTGKIPLNSSPPRQKISSKDDMVSRECSECENGEWEKDVFYVIVHTDTDNEIESMWIVQGKCMNAPSKSYESVERSLKKAINQKQIDGVKFNSDTNEIGRVSGIDSLDSTNLRVRGMFSMKHPDSHFEGNIMNYNDKLEKNPLFMVMTQNKFEQMPSKTKHNIKNNSNINLKTTQIEDPEDDDSEISAIIIESF